MSAPVVGPRTSDHGLAWLLRPVTPEEFLGSFWERRPLHVRRDHPAYYCSLPGLLDVDGLITTTELVGRGRTPSGRVVRTSPDGRVTDREFRRNADGTPDVHDIYRCYDGGYTIVLNSVHRRSPAVAAVCRALETDLQHPVGANLYLTPRNAQGFRPHTDSHDVVVVQIHGTKQWRVGADAAVRFPTPDAPGDPVQAVVDAVDYVMAPGDALYLPRGYAHEALTQASSSLHLTIGIQAFTRADLIAEALNVLAGEQSELRRALSTGEAEAESEPELVTEEVLAGLTDPRVLRAARAALSSRLTAQQSAATGHFASLDSIPELDLGSVVVRGFTGPCHLSASGERLVASYPGNYVSVPGFLAEALEHVARTGAFTVASIPGDLTDVEKVDFVARLISEGFLSVAPNKEEVTT